MGLGSVLPFVGSSLLRGGGKGVKAATEASSIAARMGRSVDEVESMINSLGGLARDDLVFLRQAERTIANGGELSAESAKRVQGILGSIGSGRFIVEMPPAHGAGPRAPREPARPR